MAAEVELVGLCAESECEELMAEADAEDGEPAEEVPYCIDRVFDGCGVWGSVAEGNAVGLLREDPVCGGMWGGDGDVAAVGAEQAEYVSLDSEVEGDGRMGGCKRRAVVL